MIYCSQSMRADKELHYVELLLLPYFKIFVCSATGGKVLAKQKVTERAMALKTGKENVGKGGARN